VMMDARGRRPRRLAQVRDHREEGVHIWNDVAPQTARHLRRLHYKMFAFLANVVKMKGFIQNEIRK